MEEERRWRLEWESDVNAWTVKRWYGQYGGLTHLNAKMFEAMLDEEAVRRLVSIRLMWSKGWGEESWRDWWPKWNFLGI